MRRPTPVYFSGTFFYSHNFQKIVLLLKTVSLRGKSRGKSLYASHIEMNITINKIVSIITDGAPAMTIVNDGLTAFCKRKIPLSRVFFLTLCHSSACSKYKSDLFSTCDTCCTKKHKVYSC
jgi:hypothetical protein